MPDEVPVTNAILLLILSSVPISMRPPFVVVLFNDVVCISAFISSCVYAHFGPSICWLVVSRTLGLFVQSQRCGFQIGEDGGPALFTERFDHGTLSGLPGRRQFLNLLSALGGDREFHTIAASASDGLHETVPLQRTEIPH